MKKLIIFVSLLFLAMAYGKAEDKEVLKIATFNLRMDTPVSYTHLIRRFLPFELCL